MPVGEGYRYRGQTSGVLGRSASDLLLVRHALDDRWTLKGQALRGLVRSAPGGRLWGCLALLPGGLA